MKQKAENKGTRKVDIKKRKGLKGTKIRIREKKEEMKKSHEAGPSRFVCSVPLLRLPS
jgi:hypothetical protein